MKDFSHIKVPCKPTFAERFPADGGTLLRAVWKENGILSKRRIDIYYAAEIGTHRGHVSVVFEDEADPSLSYRLFKDQFDMNSFHSEHWPYEESTFFPWLDQDVFAIEPDTPSVQENLYKAIKTAGKLISSELDRVTKEADSKIKDLLHFGLQAVNMTIRRAR